MPPQSCVIGLGYIGLPTATLLASVGHNVLGVDINPSIVSGINNGSSHIDEGNLAKLLNSVVQTHSLRADLKVSKSDYYVITVPTPFYSNGTSPPQPNLDFVFAAVSAIGNVLRPGDTVLLESTCPVGTTDLVAAKLAEISNLSVDQFNLAYCPERVLPGNIIHELVHNDRVIGLYGTSSADTVRAFYLSFCKGSLHVTDSSTAEMVKLAENSFRDVNLAYANELSRICAETDIDVYELISLANYHPRVNILTPGCGVGGHCIAVDPWFLAASFPHLTPLIQSSRQVNDAKPQYVIEVIEERVAQFRLKHNRNPILTCLGLAFKPNVADLRQSPALHIFEQLVINGHSVLPCEPNLDSHPTLTLRDYSYCIAKSDIVIILVAHDEFKPSDLVKTHYLDFTGLMSMPI